VCKACGVPLWNDLEGVDLAWLTNEIMPELAWKRGDGPISARKNAGS
jgi:hypothetical protein